MASEVLEFLWQVNEAGYRWLDGKLDPAAKVERLITDGVPIGTGYRARRYDPMKDQPALFKTFADTPRTEEGVTTFANQFGLLGESRFVDQPGPPLPAEAGATWFDQIEQMHHAVNLWQLTRTGVTGRRREELATIIRWGPDPQGERAVFYAPSPSIGAVVASPNLYPEWLDRFRDGELIFPAKVYLNRLLNENLRGKASLRVLYDLQADQSVLRWVPHSLLGCMWFQFAEAVTADKELRQCAGCNLWFEVSAQGTRSDKQFCSGACRNRIYRERIDRARAMRAKGVAPKKIAEALNVDEASIKTWTSKKKGK